MKTHKATYTSEIITQNTIVEPEGCSCISFKNTGETSVFIDNAITLSEDETLSFNEKPYVEIDHAFKIRFESNTGSLLIIKTFYK